jgi:hypothetical protein
MIDPQVQVDRLLEAENLSDNLADEDAEWLLNWGVAQVRGMANQMTDSDELSKKAGALMKFMRGLNRIAGSLPDADPAAVSRLAGPYSAAFGAARNATEVEIAEAAARISSMPPRQVLEFLIEWLEPIAREES